MKLCNYVFVSCSRACLCVRSVSLSQFFSFQENNQSNSHCYLLMDKQVIAINDTGREKKECKHKLHFRALNLGPVTGSPVL